MNVSEVKVSGNRMQRIRLIVVTSLLLTLPGLMVAQSSMQTITSVAEGQTGSQSAGAALEGTISDAKGGLIAKATVIVRNDATGRIKTVIADDAGHFSIAGLPIGTYTVDASAPGFAGATLKSIHVAADHADSATLTLQIGDTTADVTVEADATGSIAAALAPMDTLLSATSARTEITSGMIQNFMSPIADFGEAVEMAPGTFTTNSNGVGLGQATTVFRGFPDGDYDIDFDGIPFYDTNTPSHHTWAFFPSQWIGGIDFDRSPGTASTIGPTPFGGSIHLLSRPFDPLQNIRGEFVGGSYHTYLYDGEYDSGQFGPGQKFNVMVDVHHTQSDGYQTFNFQTRNAGDIQVQYKLSDKTTITGYSGVVWVDANTPNFSATRCQMFGPSNANSTTTCTISATNTALLPDTGAGINFLNTNNSDPELYLDFKYNYYHVPTDFEYVEVHKVFGHGFVFDSKPYTYNYDNSEKFTNAVPISDNPALANTVYAPLGAKVVLCTTPVVKKGVTAIPCGVDKYNSYRKYGETSELDQFSKYGVFRGGIWYDWSLTHRHQFPSDPLNNWADQALSNFNETFVTNSYQPFAEYQYHATKKLDIDAGVKIAYYTVSTKQFADDGKTIGGLGTNNPDTFVTDGGSYFATLPSANANYRIRKNWSAYAQFAQGSIVPPSSTFDFIHTTDANLAPLTPPKQQRNTTYQGGSAVKLKRATLDVDYYYIRFQAGYSSVTGADGEPVFFLQPSSTTEGVEGQSNLSFGHGFGAYLNATHGKAYYRGETAATPAITGAPTLEVAVPNGQNVQMTPSDTETEALTYQHKAFDFGLFNKRVGTFFIDNGSYHNQATINPFSVTNLFFNYTVRSGGMFDQTKFRLSFNNLFNEHTIDGDTIAGTANTTTLTQTVNGTTYSYTNPFVTNGPTPIDGADNLTVLPGRSIMVSVIFGFSPHRH